MKQIISLKQATTSSVANHCQANAGMLQIWAKIQECAIGHQCACASVPELTAHLKPKSTGEQTRTAERLNLTALHEKKGLCHEIGIHQNRTHCRSFTAVGIGMGLEH